MYAGSSRWSLTPGRHPVKEFPTGYLSWGLRWAGFAGMLRPLAMSYPLSPAQRNDGRLWAVAFALSLLLNAALLVLAGISILQFERFRPNRIVSPPPPAEAVQFIAPELAPSANPSAPAVAGDPPELVPAADPAFTRTTEDQRGKRPDQPAFIGERDTQATSDTTPTPGAPAMPAQAGIEPRHPTEFETTESHYQDGELVPAAPLTANSPAPPAPLMPLAPPQPTPPATAQPGQESPTPGSDTEESSPPPADRLATGPHPVDLPVPKPVADEAPKPGPAQRPKEGQPDAVAADSELKQTSTPAPPQSTPKPPAFRGYQRKTAIHGSISRNGRSALDVEDSPLGRYQAVVSRAVELEWQRNCVRYRDFITPGFLTVRFFIDAKGKVRNVDFVGEIKTGQQQKGFTLNSIRDAAIPAMPPEVKKDFQEDPLELIFNFYF